MKQLNTIYTKLRNSFFPKDIADPLEHNLIQVSNYILLTVFPLTFFLVIYYLNLGNYIFATSTAILGVVSAIGKYLLHQHRVREVYTLLTVVIFVLTAAGILYNKGLSDSGIQIFHSVLIISAICFKPKWFKFLVVVMIVWFVIAFFLEIQGFYDNRVDANSPFIKMMISIGMVCFIAATLQLTIQQFTLSNQKLHQLKEEADRANRVKGDFLANMSHELRTPLNAIIGYSQDICEEARLGEAHIDPLYLENVNYIIRSSETLLSLINKVLDLSKLEVEQMKVQLSTFDLSELLTDLLMTLQPIAGRRDNALSFKNLSTAQYITSDQMKLRQILLNLLSNATKFTSSGSIFLEVLDADIQGMPALRFVVTDDGIGMPKEQLELIFESFMQIDDSLARSHEGTGLGLAISKSFAHLLEGDLMVESEKGKGSKFSLIIPRSSQISQAFEIPQNGAAESVAIQ